MAIDDPCDSVTQLRMDGESFFWRLSVYGNHVLLANELAANLYIAKLLILCFFCRDLGNAGLSGTLVPQLGVLTNLQYL